MLTYHLPFRVRSRMSLSVVPSSDTSTCPLDR
jgi:hypothetical protein